MGEVTQVKFIFLFWYVDWPELRKKSAVDISFFIINYKIKERREASEKHAAKIYVDPSCFIPYIIYSNLWKYWTFGFGLKSWI